MSNNIHITDLATPELQKMIGRLTQRQPLLSQLGETLAETLREHFLARNQEPNKRNWPKTNFWARIRQATALTSVTNDKATVTISDPAFPAVLRGGTFTKSHGAYAIPLRPEANGILPSSNIIPGLFLLRSRTGKTFLAKRDDANFNTVSAKTRKKKSRAVATAPKQRLTLYYLLTKRIIRHPDPRALPPATHIHTLLTATAKNYLYDTGVRPSSSRK